MFTIKNLSNTTASMTNYYRGINKTVTDFNVGSKIRTLFESVGIEIETFYKQVWRGLMEAIDTAVYKSFAFPKLKAGKAYGTITFTCSGAGTIASGTRVAVPNTNKIFETTASTTVVGAGDVGIVCQAVSLGADYNTGIHTVTQLVTTNAIITAVINDNPITTGTDIETDTDRATRFQQYVNSISRSTADGVLYGAKSAKLLDGDGNITEYVQSDIVDETDPSKVRIYVWNGDTGASVSLLTEVAKIVRGYTGIDGVKVEGYISAGVAFDVYAVSALSISFVLAVQVAEGYTLSAIHTDIDDALADYVQNISMGGTYIHTEAIARVQNVEGVEDVSFTSPTTNQTILNTQKLILNTITLTEM